MMITRSKCPKCHKDGISTMERAMGTWPYTNPIICQICSTWFRARNIIRVLVAAFVLTFFLYLSTLVHQWVSPIVCIFLSLIVTGIICRFVIPLSTYK